MPKARTLAPGCSTSSRRLNEVWLSTSSSARFSPLMPTVTCEAVPSGALTSVV